MIFRLNDCFCRSQSVWLVRETCRQINMLTYSKIIYDFPFKLLFLQVAVCMTGQGNTWTIDCCTHFTRPAVRFATCAPYWTHWYSRLQAPRKVNTLRNGNLCWFDNTEVRQCLLMVWWVIGSILHAGLPEIFLVTSIGARCSSVVRALAHGVMGRRIDPSWSGPIELFLDPASAPRLV